MAIEVFRGDDKTINLTFKDASQTPINLSGSTVYFTVKKKIEFNDDKAVIQKDVTSHTDETAGTTAVLLSNADTNISPDTYVYDIQYKDAAGAVTTVLKDDFVVKPDVTRRND